MISKEGREPRETRFVEVKVLKHIDKIILTDNEKSFGEENERIGGEYWLYIVDLRGETPRIRGYRKPLSTGALEHIESMTKDNRTYHIYREAREPDEEW